MRDRRVCMGHWREWSQPSRDPLRVKWLKKRGCTQYRHPTTDAGRLRTVRYTMKRRFSRCGDSGERNGQGVEMDTTSRKWARQLTLLSQTGPQVYPRLAASQVAAARHHPDPARRALPRQARRSPEDPRPGCPPRHRPLQDQRRSPTKSQCPIRHRHLPDGRPLRCRHQEDR